MYLLLCLTLFLNQLVIRCSEQKIMYIVALNVISWENMQTPYRADHGYFALSKGIDNHRSTSVNPLRFLWLCSLPILFFFFEKEVVTMCSQASSFILLLQTTYIQCVSLDHIRPRYFTLATPWSASNPTHVFCFLSLWIQMLNDIVAT